MIFSFVQFWEPEETIAEGFNLIGIYPGQNFGSKDDKLIVVGAHWDTTGFTDGLNDNGSGPVAVLFLPVSINMVIKENRRKIFKLC